MLTAIFILSVMVVVILLMIANIWYAVKDNQLKDDYRLDKALLLCTQLIGVLENILKDGPKDDDVNIDIVTKEPVDNMDSLETIREKMEGLIHVFDEQ